MLRSARAAWLSVVLGLFGTAISLTACGGGNQPDAGDATDAPREIATDVAMDTPDVRTACVVDVDCSDGTFCNGVERCMPGATNADARGCVAAMPATPCLAGQTCSESMLRCVTDCPHALDADGDGHRAVDCGGDDCDDSDANRFPGNPEVCDANNRDEDCDARTFGFRDVDMDNYVDSQCCNVEMGGAMHCGDDCNDSRANEHPSLAEACDQLDNNCNAMTDEGVTRSFYPDVDGDGFGDSNGTSMPGCVPPAGYAEQGGDCNDSNAAVHPGAVEQCDLTMVDENCDGMANPTALCTCSGDISRMCALPGACAAGTQRCINGGWGACTITPTAEVCNGVDDDCDNATDEELSVTCYPDGDNDGYSAAGATSVRSCPVPGRDAFAGCPPNQTNRPPLGIDIDCNDTDSTVSPGQPELCDSTMRDENCDGTSNPPSLCMCTEGQSRPCTAVGSCGAGAQTCSGGRYSACSVNPVAESCNAIDDDCDGMTDEGLTVTCYPDNDNDGYAAMTASAIQSCPVMGRDGVGGCPTNQTNRVPTGSNVDCNDTNAAVSPGAVELCDTAMVDENCDGMANPAATCACSGTAMRACPLAGSCAAGTQTCNGGTWGNCSITPVAENCNAIDDDCDGMTDEGLTVTCYPDADNDGYAATGATARQSCPVAGREALGGCPTNQTNRVPGAGAIDCNDAAAGINPGAAEVCDGALVDENCDGSANPTALCACSGNTTRACTLSGACAAGSQTCSNGTFGPCSVLPVTEICNGADDDCDGTIDEGLTVTCYADADNDGYSAMGASTIQSCPVAGRTAVGGCPTNQTNRAPTAGSADCADMNAAINPGAIELCDASMVDENCDGASNPTALCACSGSTTRTCTLSGACAAGTQTCTSGSWGNCSITPVSESCNNIDDDCDGTTDEGLTVTCYADADNDGFAAAGAATIRSCPVPGRESVGGCPTNQTNVAPSGSNIDCADMDSTRRPAARETCNGIDDNCNGSVDEGALVSFYIDRDRDGFGAAGSTASTGCTAPSGYVANADDCNDTRPDVSPIGAEVCDGLDQDCNGTVDDAAATDPLCASAAAGGFSVCRAGACRLIGCPIGMASCSRSGTPRCDTNIVTDVTNCGACGVQCGAGAVCQNGRCDALVSIAAGIAFGCGVRQSGNVLCWGANNNGQLGNGGAGDQVPPGVVLGISDAVAVAGGGVHACALRRNATIACWGGNNSGQLGDGSTTAHFTATPVPGLASIAEVATGDQHTCARTTSGAVYCWGSNGWGEVGTGTVGGIVTSPTLVTGLPAGDAVVQLELANGLTCARTASGAVLCWGRGDHGQLQAQTGQPSATPVLMTTMTGPATDVAIGGSAICVLHQGDGVVFCWGDDQRGQLGSGISFGCIGGGGPPCSATAYRATFASGAALAGMTDIEGGGRMTGGPEAPLGAFFCARGGASGALYCWGSNDSGELGNGGNTDAHHVVPGPSYETVAQIALGGQFACAREPGGIVSCWGANGSAQLNDGSTTNRSSATVAQFSTRGIGYTHLDGGTAHTCWRRATGEVRCWGANAAGQVGDGTTTQRLEPVSVAGMVDGSEVSAGGDHSCARRTNGTVACWGSNASGQLGDGTTTNRNAPVNVAGITDAVQVTVGGAHTCAMRATRQVVCWGSNASGQLGDGTTTNRTAPVTVVGLGDAVEVQAGGSHTCARRTTGAIVCWGANAAGQLGDRTNTNRTSPVTVATIDDATRLAAGISHTCALRAIGQAMCWGDNTNGQLGDATTTARNVPVLVVGLIGPQDVWAGERHSCASRAGTAMGVNSEIVCWGDNTSGQLGNGNTAPASGLQVVGSGLFTNVGSVGVGARHACALASTPGGGFSGCWGANGSGQLGDNTTTTRSSPTPIDPRRLN